MTEPGDPEGKLYWFVYSEDPITCLQGTPFWWNWDKLRFFGCIGEPDSLASLQEWTRVELVTYGQGLWIARVDDLNGNVADVAQITTTQYTIYRANVNMEQAYSDIAAPYLLGRFFFWHPQYMEWGVGFHDWPASLGPNINDLYATSIPLGINKFCPQHYGATINLLGDSRYWYLVPAGKSVRRICFLFTNFYQLFCITKTYSGLTSRISPAVPFCPVLVQGFLEFPGSNSKEVGGSTGDGSTCHQLDAAFVRYPGSVTTRRTNLSVFLVQLMGKDN